MELRGKESSDYLCPGRLTAGSPTNHPFGKENDLNQTSMILFQPLILRSVAPTIVINGVITPLTGRKRMGNWGYFTPFVSGRGPPCSLLDEFLVDNKWICNAPSLA